MDARHPLYRDGQENNGFVQAFVMLDIKLHGRRNAVPPACQIDRDARDTGHFFALHLLPEGIEAWAALSDVVEKRCTSTVPGRHNHENADARDDRYISTFQNLRDIGAEEGGVHNEEQ